MNDYLTEGWPLWPTRIDYGDGTGAYNVCEYDQPGRVARVALTQDQAKAIRDVVEHRIQQAKAEAWQEGVEAAYEDDFWPDGCPRYNTTTINPYAPKEQQ